MNEHTGFHEYKDSKRFNPECLVCLKEEEQEKKWIFEGSLLMLKEAIGTEYELRQEIPNV